MQIPCFQHFCLGLLDELTDIANIGVLKAVIRADREFQFIDTAFEVFEEVHTIHIDGGIQGAFPL